MSGKVEYEGGLRSPFEQDPEVVMLLGSIITVWGAVGHVLRSVGVKLLQCTYEEADAELSKYLGDGKRIQVLIDRATEDDEMLAALQRVKDLVDERNLVVHGAPLYGGRHGLFNLGLHIVNFRQPDPGLRFTEAAPFLNAHLEKIRAAGGALWDVAYDQQLLALGDDGYAVYPR